MTVVPSPSRVEWPAISPHVPDIGDSAARVVCLLLAAAAAALVPVARQVAGSEIYFFYVAVAALAVIPILVGQAASPVGAAVWIASIPLVGFGAMAGGSASLRTGAPLVIMCAAAPFALRGLHERGPTHQKFVGVAFLCTQTISAAVGIAQYLGAHPLGISYLPGRPQGLAGHANVLGLMSGIATLLLLNAIIRGYGSRLLCALALLLNVVALVGSGSLTALGATVAAVCLLLWAQRKVLVVMLAFVALIPLGFVSSTHVPVVTSLVETVDYRSDVVRGLDGGYGIASVEERFWTYQYAINGVRESPLFGVGLQHEVSGTYDGITATHNFFLRGWFQGGITYAVWLIFLVAMILSRIIGPAVVRRSSDLALPASGSLLILTFASTAAFLEQAHYWLPLIFFATMVAPSDAKRRSAVQLNRWHGNPESRAVSAPTRRPQHRPNVTAVRRNHRRE